MNYNRWVAWSIQSVNRKIFAAIITVGSMTLVVKLAVTAQHLILAHQFGTGDAVDAYIIAFLIPSFTLSIISGALNAAFLPAFIRVREKSGEAAAQQLFSNVTFWSVGLIVMILVIMGLLAPILLPFLGAGFDPAKLDLTRRLFYLLLPVVCLNGFSSLWASILNAGERFLLAAFAPIAIPIITIILLITVGKIMGIYALAAGTIIGFFLEALILGHAILKSGFSLKPRWIGIDPAMRQVIGQFLPMAAGALLMSSTDLIDKSMAAMLDPGSVSALGYGNKIVLFLLNIGSFALSTAVFPHFSNMVIQKDWNGIRHILKWYGTFILIISVPLTALLFYFSEPIISVIYERGRFSSGDTLIVSKIQACYVLQTPFYLLGILGVRLLSALAKNQILMVISGVSLVINIFGNILFIKLLGVAGIGLSTSLVYAVSSLLIMWMLYEQLKKKN